MTRRRLTSLQRVRIFDAHHGVCHICQRRIQVGEAWQLDHRQPLWQAGGDAPENLSPAHVVCHAGKTGQEHHLRAKGDRIRARHIGVKKTPQHIWGYGRADKFKRKLDGTVVRRNQEGSQ